MACIESMPCCTRALFLCAEVCMHTSRHHSQERGEQHGNYVHANRLARQATPAMLAAMGRPCRMTARAAASPPPADPLVSTHESHVGSRRVSQTDSTSATAIVRSITHCMCFTGKKGRAGCVDSLR